MTELGYKDLEPATTLVAPGTLVWVIDTAPMRVGLVCGRGESLGLTFQPDSSSSAQINVSNLEHDTLTFDASYLAILKANAAYDALSGITFSLTNVKILEADQALVVGNLVHRTDDC